MTEPLAVVGAGAAGAAAAYRLRDADRDVTVFEKSRGVCGRAATRRKHGCRYDHGANYVKPGDGPVQGLLDELGSEGRHDIAEPVWTFDGDGAVAPGRDGDGPKWTWEAGITQLAKRLFAEADAAVHRETRIESLAREGGRWTLTDADGETYGPFADVLLTPPAPQTADLLGATDWGGDRLADARDAVAAVPYRSVVTAVLHYTFELDREWYALVNTDDAHDVGWLSREACKPGHVPDGESLLVVQMAPDWSREHYDDPASEQTEAAAELAAELVGDDRLRDPDWTDTQGWRYALPEAAVDREPVAALANAGLHVAGDWVVGEGRVHRALESGLAAGDRLR
ncbi:NAD(P)/FAD-dependent oxidoreductase [Halobacterium litoreum]|uniref:NAD(P)/FAD-dependent oxidoreductase n=1 Tax=Halobacterium litoreum TaxID=2039234 RepID=A0ABD5NHP7_9EURY|nr:FAD-dependent oxidoreductase [Halobacterium litoreum]UHH12395.1 FAD-dependent oxidoreductase [Halobacterium litoreum]